MGFPSINSSARDARRNPIFDVMFTYNNWKDEPYDLNLENILNKTARFDLILHSVEKNKTFFFAFDGTSLLAIALQEAGFFVKNVGIMNQLEDFLTVPGTSMPL